MINDPLDQYSNIQPLVKKEINDAIEKYADEAKSNVAQIPAHKHTGVDSFKISYSDLEDISSNIGKMYLANTQTINNNTPTAITLDTSQISSGVTVDTSNNRLTVLIAGYYSICGQICWTQSTDAKNYKSYITVGNTEVVTSFVHASVTGSFYIATPLNTVLYLNAGDNLKLYGSQVSGGSQTVGGGYNYTFLSIFKIN